MIMFNLKRFHTIRCANITSPPSPNTSQAAAPLDQPPTYTAVAAAGANGTLDGVAKDMQNSGGCMSHKYDQSAPSSARLSTSDARHRASGQMRVENDKLSHLITYPIDGLDMSSYISDVCYNSSRNLHRDLNREDGLSAALVFICLIFLLSISPSLYLSLPLSLSRFKEINSHSIRHPSSNHPKYIF